MPESRRARAAVTAGLMAGTDWSPDMSQFSTERLVPVSFANMPPDIGVGVLMPERILFMRCDVCEEWFDFAAKSPKLAECPECRALRSRVGRQIRRHGHPFVKPPVRKARRLDEITHRGRTVRQTLALIVRDLGKADSEYVAAIERKREAARLAAQQAADGKLDYRREAVKVGDGIDHRSIFKRDKYTCHICGLPVDQSKSGHHPLGATLDHIHPLVHGGTHTIENVACAHSYCNGTKNARMTLTESQVDRMRIHIQELLSLKTA